MSRSAPRNKSAGAAHKTPPSPPSRTIDTRNRRQPCCSNARTCSAPAAFKFRGAYNAASIPPHPPTNGRAAAFVNLLLGQPRAGDRAPPVQVLDIPARDRDAVGTPPAVSNGSPPRGYGRRSDPLRPRQGKTAKAIGRRPRRRARADADFPLTITPATSSPDKATATRELIEEAGPPRSAGSSPAAAAGLAVGISALAARGDGAGLQGDRRRGRRRGKTMRPWVVS